MLFHVERGTMQTSNRVVDLADKRRGETAASRVAPVRGKATREAVASVHAESGVDVCLGCAAGVIAEARATAGRKEAAEAATAAAATAKTSADDAGSESSAARVRQHRARRRLGNRARDATEEATRRRQDLWAHRTPPR